MKELAYCIFAFEQDLTLCKEYEIISQDSRSKYIEIVDDSEESYFYPESWFWITRSNS